MKTEPTESLKEIKRCSWEVDFEISDGLESYEVVDKNDAINIANIAFREGQSSPKIKQLEWEDTEDTDIWYFKSKISLGLRYSITGIKGTYIVHLWDAPISWEKSLESAKSVAQRDFEKRIKECLE